MKNWVTVFGVNMGSKMHLTEDWFAPSYLAIDQGPIIVMIENYRTGLIWKLFMSHPDVQKGLKRLGFTSPYLNKAD